MPPVATPPRKTGARHGEGLAWRLIHDEPRSGARNMALDHALAECLGAAGGVVRIYAWERPTVSFGKNELADGRYSRDRAEALGIDYVRRPTGGRAVLHDDELTYAVVAPVGAMGTGLREPYRRVNELLAEGLASLTVPVELSTVEQSSRLDAGPCFQFPAPGELVTGGRKLAGSAQARIGRTLLQHGSILVGGDQATVAELSGVAPNARASTTLRELLGHVSIDEVAQAVAMSLRRGLGGTWASAGYTPEELEAADRLERERYAKESWTWRR